MAAEPLRVVPDQLPDGWLPESFVVIGFAKQPEGDCDVWEVLFPQFTIAGRGESIHDAVENAAELLEDYWRMCASEGLSFEACRRPIGAFGFSSLLAGALAGAVANRLRRHARRRPRLLNIPVDGSSAHLAI